MSSTTQTLLQQTKAYVSDTITAVKETFGFDQYPQSKVVHSQEYLNDIVKGNWNLSHNSNMSVKHCPVVGFPADFKWHEGVKFNTKFNRCPFLEEVRQGTTLRPVTTNDRCRMNWGKEYKYRQRGDRKALMREIREFSRGDLNAVPILGKPGLMDQAKEYMQGKLDQVKEAFGYETYSQGKTEHDRLFLNDIAKGNWESLQHVSVSEKTVPVVGVDPGVHLNWGQDVKLRKNERKELLEKVKEGCNLNHVETIDKSKAKIEPDFKLKGGVDRQHLLHEIHAFEGQRLSHVGSS